MDTGIAEKVSVFGVILVRIFPYLLRTSRYSDRMREYTGQKNSEYGHFQLQIRTFSVDLVYVQCPEGKQNMSKLACAKINSRKKFLSHESYSPWKLILFYLSRASKFQQRVSIRKKKSKTEYIGYNSFQVSYTDIFFVIGIKIER